MIIVLQPDRKDQDAIVRTVVQVAERFEGIAPGSSVQLVQGSGTPVK